MRPYTRLQPRAGGHYLLLEATVADVTYRDICLDITGEIGT